MVNGCVWAGVVIIPLIGLLVFYHLFRHHDGTAGLWWRGPVAHLFIIGHLHPIVKLNLVTIGLIWAILLYVSKKARWFLIQYVGDVAAYVSAHTVNKFYETRQQIQRVATSVARAVYQAKKPDNTPAYSEIIVVGHSLGSVVGYDTLNAMILEDLIYQKMGCRPGRDPLLPLVHRWTKQRLFLGRNRNGRMKSVKHWQPRFSR
jgi:hypothetical protein